MIQIALLAMLGFFVPHYAAAPAPTASVHKIQHAAPAISPPPAPVAEVKEPTVSEQITEAAAAAGAPPDTMRAIAWCESRYKQFKNGRPNVSPTADVGTFQINQVHDKETAQLGLDIASSTADNIKFAMILYQRNGVSDWENSSHCWRPLVTDPRLIPNG